MRLETESSRIALAVFLNIFVPVIGLCIAEAGAVVEGFALFVVSAAYSKRLVESC